MRLHYRARGAAMAAALTASLYATLASAQIQENKADPFLAEFVGVWDGPPVGGEADKLSQVTSNSWRLNNRWMLFYVTERSFGKSRKTFASETYLGYDPEAKQYEAYVFDTIGVTPYAGTRVGDKSIVLTRTASDGRTERLTFTKESPLAFTRMLETSRDGSLYTTFSSVRFAKRTGSSSRSMPDQ